MRDFIKIAAACLLDVASATLLAVAIAGYVASRERDASLLISTFGETAAVLSVVLSCVVLLAGFLLERVTGRWWHVFLSTALLGIGILSHAWLPGVSQLAKPLPAKVGLPDASKLNNEAQNALIDKQIQQMTQPPAPVAESVEPSSSNK